MNQLIFRFAGLAVIAVLLGIPSVGLADERPNIVVIFTDDHGYADLSSQGIVEDIRTPHTDALAAGGVRATSGYVTAPQCVPSRGGLLVGKHQNRFGLESNGQPLAGFNAETTIAERLQAAGYATGQIGKWHLGPKGEIPRHGFDDVYAKNANRPGVVNYTLGGEEVPIGPRKDGLYHIDACSEAARVFIERHRDEPFFLYLAYRAPHVPLDAPAKYLKRFPGEMPHRRRQALAMLSAVDDGVGLVMETLHEHGLEEETLVFYIGDNGAPLKIHKYDAPGGGPGWDGSLNKPLNGEKGMLTEGGIRVPYVVHWEGTIPGGQVYRKPVISLDVAATAAAIAGLDVKAGELDGVNLLPYLTGEAEGRPHEALMWRWVAQAAIRVGDWKLLRGGEREYLFNLAEDKAEKHDLRDEHPKIADRLRSRLKAWASELDPPGLATRPMARVWNQYFDYYIEGEPAPPLRKKVREKSRPKRVQGWIARNSTLAVKGEALRVRPSGGNKRRAPFIAQNGLRVEGPAQVRLRLNVKEAGRLGVQWRMKGQERFPAEQKTTVKLEAGRGWRERVFEVPERGRVVHIRVMLPAGKSAIRSIEVTDRAGETAGAWSFGE